MDTDAQSQLSTTQRTVLISSSRCVQCMC
uniref:Uncharacterized protein n=1 Tax=Arundo donax TaxID=35708 RepID=A0A0A9GF12_ARUDO